VPYSFQGIGTMLIGERDYALDGSYVTTEWFVFLMVPVLPLRSLRVSNSFDPFGSNSTPTLPFATTISESYRVLETRAPCLKQVMSVYGFVVFYAVCLAMPFIILARLRDHISLGPELGPVVFTAFVMCMAVIPWALPWQLRRRAKAQMRTPKRPHQRQPDPEISSNDDLENPLDVHMDVRVTAAQYARGEALQVQVPGEEGTISVPLQPHMQGKVLRLRNALKRGAAHLFLRLLVVEEFKEPSSDSNEVARLRQNLRSKILNNETLIDRLIQAERDRMPGSGEKGTHLF
jgi:hypothetical protein